MHSLLQLYHEWRFGLVMGELIVNKKQYTTPLNYSIQFNCTLITVVHIYMWHLRLKSYATVADTASVMAVQGRTRVIASIASNACKHALP